MRGNLELYKLPHLASKQHGKRRSKKDGVRVWRGLLCAGGRQGVLVTRMGHQGGGYFTSRREHKLVLRALGAGNSLPLDSGRWWHGPALVVKTHEVVHLRFCTLLYVCYVRLPLKFFLISFFGHAVRHVGS